MSTDDSSKSDILIRKAFDSLYSKCMIFNKVDRGLIIKAFEFANEAHRGVKRKSGEPFILHPIAVAQIVAHDIGLGAKAIASALLHDVVEDTEYTSKDIEKQFGKQIAVIVNGLTKIPEIFDEDKSIQAENFKKTLMTLKDDVRVILIKLADRLHNMRTLGAMLPHKQMKIAGETIYFYAPIANKLGLYHIKTELEDLSLKYRYPLLYDEIKSKMEIIDKTREIYISNFIAPIVEKLQEQKISYRIKKDPKSIYSVWYQMNFENVSFEEAYDLLSINIIFAPTPNIPEKTQCWQMYSLITDTYVPKPERIRDFVTKPKANGYEGLHATFMGPNGKWVDVQIRTTRMNDIAEHGFAAYIDYKNDFSQQNELEKWLEKARQLLEEPWDSTIEFIDDFKLNLYAAEIMVFTPKGQLRTMPQNCTVLDFAYEIHTEIGNKAIAAKINHKLVQLNEELKSGDQVEIITGDINRVNYDWIDWVKTAHAKACIKKTLKATNKGKVGKGKEMLEEKLKTLNLTPSSRVFQKILPAYNVSGKEELYSKIGSEIIKLDKLEEIVRIKRKNNWVQYWGLQLMDGIRGKKNDKNNEGSLFEEEEQSTNSYQIATCCNPIPGDEVIGCKDDNDIIVHKASCKKAIKIMSNQGNRLVPVTWKIQKKFSYLVRIKLEGMDSFSIYNEITTEIAKELNIKIRSFNIESHNGIIDGFVDLYIHNVTDLNNLMANLRNIKEIESAKRVEIEDN